MNEAIYPAGTGTYSKARNQFPENAPRFARFGAGASIFANDGKWYLDYTMGLGAISLGYADYDVETAVHAQLRRGSIFGLPTELEFEFAEEFVSTLPWANPAVKYGKNGSDVTSAAVRAARAITGRAAVLSVGYHGWSDWCCPNLKGIPQDVLNLTVTTQGKFDRIGDDYACVIVEPDLVADLPALRAECDRTGTLLVFDEMLTGFRLEVPGAMSYYGVTPDLACFGKAISNGLPLSVVAGPEKYMRVFGGDIGYSFTYGGETLSLAAGLATVRKYKREPVIAHLRNMGLQLRDTWNSEADRLGLFMPAEGFPQRSVIKWPSLEHRTLVSQEMFKRDICFTVGFTVCYAHTQEEIEQTQQAIKEVLAIVASVDEPAELLEGPVVSHKPFRAMTA